MPSRVLTETHLKNLQKKPPAKQAFYSEPGRKGFMLRHHPGGELTFLVRYKIVGKEHWLTLGSWPVLSIAAAHEEHLEIRKQLANGLDPKIERERRRIERQRQEEKRQVTEAITVRNVIAEWAWHHARRHRTAAASPSAPGTGERQTGERYHEA